MKKYYLQVGRANDLESPRERIIYRAFEILPGFLSWTTLILVIFLSWAKPIWIAFFIIIFDLYWFLRAIHFSVHLIFTYRKMKEHLKTDWLEKLKNLSVSRDKLPIMNWPDIYHLVIFPMYKEELALVKASFQALLKSDYPKEKMMVVLAIEERAGEKAQKIARVIEKEFSQQFFRFLITVHPQDIVGEIAGKGSNQTWAGRQVKEKIIDPLKIPSQNIIVSCFDIDTQVAPGYFSCLTYHYLTAEKPTRTSFQPIPLYNNNIWQAPIFSRLVATCNVFWQMMQQARPEKLVTFSSHSMSWQAVVEMDFWQTNIVSEDAGIFWKAFLFYDGDYQIIPLFYPVSMDACLAPTLKETALNQYKQQRRWAWGVEGIPYLLFGFFKDIFNQRKIAWLKKFRYSFMLLGGFWAWAVASLLILILGWLPLVLGGQEFNLTILSYNLPHLTRDIMSLAMIGLFVSAIISTLLLPPRPAGQPAYKSFFMVLQWLCLPVTIILFGALPALEAQSRLMLGKYMGFWVTPKMKKG